MKFKIIFYAIFIILNGSTTVFAADIPCTLGMQSIEVQKKEFLKKLHDETKQEIIALLARQRLLGKHLKDATRNTLTLDTYNPFSMEDRATLFPISLAWGGLKRDIQIDIMKRETANADFSKNQSPFIGIYGVRPWMDDRFMQELSVIRDKYRKQIQDAENTFKQYRNSNPGR